MDFGVNELLVLGAFICASLAAFGVATLVHLGWTAMALFFLSVLIEEA